MPPKQLQNLDTFVLQILSSDLRSIVGTGFVVSLEGLVATCWHVVQQALGHTPQSEDVVYIRLPGSEEPYSAELISPLISDDVAILRLLEGEILPFGWSSAILGSTEDIHDHRYKTKGYAQLRAKDSSRGHTGLRANGIIMGHYEHLIGPAPQVAPLQLNTDQIFSGMSGAPVLDVETSRVVGMISDIWIPDARHGASHTQVAVSSESLLIAWPSLELRASPPSSLPDAHNLPPVIIELLQLSGYRVLESEEMDTGFLFTCQTIRERPIKTVLVYVVLGDITAADQKRFEILVRGAKAEEGKIITIPAEDGLDYIQ